ncbi:hypothetical protein O181_053319 [Austropuccinia psidii MF-1]|uniref:Reverse transcriptase Ty1/copia-type domain-containing protein n=1 Tax=Austropuccinia psidii MF-1 TaxID=1389203 RepID=A0A9Q3E2F3_9BASI|nr:hypothetical protein [Austropuccinia psidii MF-1]
MYLGKIFSAQPLDDQIKECSGSYWAEAVRAATYLENITPKRLLDHSTPFNKWFKISPAYHHLQPFLFLCYYINNLIRGKFSDCGSEGIFLGYEEGNQVYQILDRQTNLDQKAPSSNPRVTVQGKENSSEIINLEISALMLSLPDPEPKSIENSTERINPKTNLPILSRPDPEPDSNPPPKGKVGDSRNVIESRRRPNHSVNAVLLLDKEFPKNFHQAMKSDLHQHWEDAIQKELDYMEKPQVWSPTTLKEDTKLLSATWVFKCKTNEDGNLTKFKAQLCIQGFPQNEGIYYGDVSSPTRRLTSL